MEELEELKKIIEENDQQSNEIETQSEERENEQINDCYIQIGDELNINQIENDFGEENGLEDKHNEIQADLFEDDEIRNVSKDSNESEEKEIDNEPRNENEDEQQDDVSYEEVIIGRKRKRIGCVLTRKKRYPLSGIRKSLRQHK